MCNPDDEVAWVDGEPSPESVVADCRTTGQRNHDALKALARAMLASGQLGSHNGLPVTLIVSTTLKELESRRGHAVTAGGSLLPMSEVIRQAAEAHYYLAVFDNHRKLPLYLGRSRRLASAAQRIVLYAKDRGCSRAPLHHCSVDEGAGLAAEAAAGGVAHVRPLGVVASADTTVHSGDPLLCLSGRRGSAGRSFDSPAT